MRRLARNILVFITAIIVVVAAMVTAFSTRSAYADGENLGSETTAMQKAYSAALASCIKSSDSWRTTAWGLGDKIASDTIRRGDWFTTNLSGFNTYATTWAGGAIVEVGVTGEYEDGKIYCGEDNSAVISKALSSFRTVNLNDIECNYKDNYVTSGVFYSDPEKTTCRDMISGDNKIYLSSNRGKYYEDMITDKVFNNDIPGGSLYTLTDLEKYYVYYNSFTAACTMGGTPNFDAPDLAYQVIVFNPSTGRFQKAGFSQKNDTDKLVYTFNGDSVTCGNLTLMLGYEGNAFFKAYHDEIMNSPNGPVANCKELYNEQLDVIKAYKDTYQRFVSAATSFRNKASYLLKEVDNGGSVPMSEVDELSAAMSDALGQINGVDVFSRNAFEQLLNAVGAVVEVNYLEEEVPSEMRTATNRWLGEVDGEITRAQNNLSTIDGFIKQNGLDKVQAWKYEDDELNMTCLAEELATKWNDETFVWLPGAPEIDGTFNPGDYIDSSLTPSGTDGDAVATCYNSTSLGWILCSGIELVGGVTKWAYDYIVENFLVVDARFLSNPNTFDAWEIFQGFANVIFAILFIIVIFSQVTGFGLSNYGIKKALPKLIMVAILVNLSYIIGSIAIDLSNILGESLQSLFEGLANNFKTVGAFNFSNVVGDVLSFLLTGVGVTTITVAAFNWDLWLPVFGLALIGMVFSIMFFFMILAVRQVGVIILLVLAPVAIVCYALPNTKSIFERWKKMFISLLVVYPVCGALIGGGTFASTLLLAASGDHKGFFYNLVAMLIQVVPFFFIPTLVRSSMTAIGNAGNRISNFGRGLSKGTTGIIRKSDGFRRFQAGTQKTAGELSKWRAEKRNELRKKGRLGKIASYIPGMGGIGAAYRGSSLLGAEVLRKSYDRKTARRTRAVTAQMESDLRDRLTAKRGTDVAEANANQALREDYTKAFQRKVDFMTSVDEQKKELIEALDAMEINTEDQDNLARLRAVQDIMSRSDEGQTAMQRVYNRRLWTEQEAAKAAGRKARVSQGMRTAAANLMNDHPELKGMNRGFFSMLAEMKNEKNHGEVFENGTFEAKTYIGADGNPVVDRDANGKAMDIIGNNRFDAMGGFKYDPQSLANAGESALQRLASSIGTVLSDGRMSMSPEAAAATYRSATEAITSKSIQVKPENEKYLNNIRRAAYSVMQADFMAKNAKNYYDRQGREYKFDATTNEYVRQDSSGAKRFRRDATGNLVSNTGGTREQINKSKLFSASDKFEREYGRYQEVHAPLNIRH